MHTVGQEKNYMQIQLDMCSNFSTMNKNKKKPLCKYG